MEFITVKRDTAEWLYMWLWLEENAINEGLEEPTVAENDGEVWQYVGSYKNGSKVVHEFRHRNHPKTNDVEKRSLHASDSFTDDQIEDSKKVK